MTTKRLTELQNHNGTLSSTHRSEIFGIPIGAPISIDRIFESDLSEAQLQRFVRQAVRSECPANANAYVLGDILGESLEREDEVHRRSSMNTILEDTQDVTTYLGYHASATVQFYRI